jgi:hypothetical protein
MPTIILRLLLGGSAVPHDVTVRTRDGRCGEFAFCSLDCLSPDQVVIKFCRSNLLHTFPEPIE